MKQRRDALVLRLLFTLTVPPPATHHGDKPNGKGRKQDSNHSCVVIGDKRSSNDNKPTAKHKPAAKALGAQPDFFAGNCPRGTDTDKPVRAKFGHHIAKDSKQ